MMKKADADREIETMEAVLETLERSRAQTRERVT
jgi:hypothetical protein